MHAPQTHLTDSTIYRPDIDGLRALAVVAVVFYHAFPDVIRGGYVGVDVFFIISGFLISSIIFRGLIEGRFSLADFYFRRVRRIFPALAVCLTGVLAYGFICLLPFELAQLGKHIFFGTSFLSNIVLWRESGYFNVAATLKPLLHLWSLAIEEQFYIFWPALLLLAHKRTKNFLAIILVLFAMSFAINIALAQTHIIADFYLPISRFWEILAGASLAAIGQPKILSQRLLSILSLSGLTLLLLAMALFDSETRFPGWPALLPVAGTMALIFAGPKAMANRLLSNRLAVSVGLISYPLYLWHWPLISFAYITGSGTAPTTLVAALLVTLSFVLAWATYYFIEIPIRFGRHRHSLTKFSIAWVAALGCCGIIMWTQKGFPERFENADLLKISQAKLDADFQPTEGMNVVSHDRTLVTVLGNGDRKIAFGGDTLLFHFGPRAQQLADQNKLGSKVYFVSGGSCAPVPGVVQRDDFEHCANLPDLLIDLVKRDKVQTVVLGANWQSYANANLPIIRDGQQFSQDSENRNDAFYKRKDAFYANLTDYVRSLQAEGAKVYLILGLPISGHFNPSAMLSRGPLSNFISPRAYDEVPIHDLREKVAESNSDLLAVAQATGAMLLDPFPDICGTGNGCSPFFGTREPKFSDGMHLRPIFVKDHIHFFDHLLN